VRLTALSETYQSFACVIRLSVKPLPSDSMDAGTRGLTPSINCSATCTATGAWAAIRSAVRRTAAIRRLQARANLDHSWIGTDASSLFVGRLMRPVVLLNDADAAGIAELSYGAVRGVPGVVLVVTLGTGIGTALFINGSLVPNTEIGHLVLDGDDMCFTACAAARANEQLSWRVWAARLEKYLRYAEDLLWPDLIVIGGGVSREADRFLPYVDIRTPITTAQLQNEAGIIGAALAAGHG